jgi:hypothetical protein
MSTDLPACVTRDNLTGPYFPNLSRGGLSAVIVLSAIFALTSFNRLNHTDLWGHLNFGRWIVATGTLPAADPFAAAANRREHAAATDSPRMLHAAWLAQVIGYEVQRQFGPEGLVFGHALLVTLAAAALMAAVASRGAPVGWAWVAGAAMFVLDLPIVGTIRPQLFGQLGLGLFLLAAAQLPKSRWPLVWIPVVAALWANLHGSILMGLAVLGTVALGTTCTLVWQSRGNLAATLRDGQIPRLWLALVLAIAGACCGPHGIWLLPRTIFFGEHAALASIVEWQAPAMTSLTGILLLASLALTVILVKQSPRRWELYEIVILALFAIATFAAMRMLAWWALVWPWVAVPHAAAAWEAYRRRQAGDAWQPAPDEPTAMRTVLAMGVVFMTLLIAPPSYSLVTGTSRGERPIMVREAPVYLASELARRELAGKIAAPMDWADFLIWKTGGNVHPLVYSHVHLTDEATWRDYQSLYLGEAAWLDILRKHELEYLVVVRQRSPQLARQVNEEHRRGNGALRIIYQDQQCILAEVALSKTARSPAGEQPRGSQPTRQAKTTLQSAADSSILLDGPLPAFAPACVLPCNDCPSRGPVSNRFWPAWPAVSS